MDPHVKELSVLLRHVPRIVVSHFLRKPELLREPASTSFTAVVALFDISGFSSLGSKLSDDEREQIKAIHSSKADKADKSNGDDGETATSRTGSISNGPRSSLPLGLGNNSASISEEEPKTTTPRSGSVRFHVNTNTNTSASGGSTTVENTDRADSVPRDLMRQRRQSAQTSQVLGGGGGARNVSFISRAKPAAPQGIAVETLTTTLNKTLEPVIDVILQHGGDIIKFAGDALIVIWETESSQGITTPEGLLVHSALRCALEALRVLHATSQRHGHTSILGMHVGIGVSRVTGNHVGGVLDRWEFYLSGDANRQMSSAEQDACKGEVVLSKEAYAALQAVQHCVATQIDVDETLRGNFLIHTVSKSALYQPKPLLVPKATLELVPFLRGYVPGTISSYLRKGLAINPCTRNITAVFIKLDGVVELESELEQLTYIQKSLRLIQESAYKVQGTLRQFVIDDKGAVAIVAVGLPPFYHENNALRGVKLASYLLDKGLRGSIGVTTGNAFCGSVGSNARAEYAVVGDIINLAARLMSSATAGEILCDEVTRDESKDSMQYDDAHEIVVKGKTTKVRVFRVQRQAQAKTRLEPTALLETVHGLPYGSEYLVESVPIFGSATHRPDRRGVHKHKHRVLIITGESGTGKSMLLRHFLHNHARSFMGSGDPVDSALDFHAWGGIIKEMLTRTIKTRRHLVSNDSGDRNLNGPSDVDLGNNADEYLESLAHDGSPQSRLGSQDGSRTFPLKAHHQQPLLGMDESDLRAATPASDMTSTGRDSPSRTLSSLTNAYERMPVLEYLILKQRISRSMAPILNDLLPYEQLYDGMLDELEHGEERTKALESLIFNIVEAVSKQKAILLIFDNAQWMDGQSWSLLVKVLDELPNVSALIATRAMHRMKRQPMYDLVEQLPYVKKQEIRRFTYQVTSLFLCQHYHIAIMDTQLLDFVFARTDGNPAELIKLMEFMIHSQFVSLDRKSGSISILSDLDDLDMQVPQYTRAKVMACVDTLDGLAQVALKLISIHPEPVEERMLNGILTMFLSASEHDDSETEGGGISSTKLKMPRSSSALSMLHQVRIGLAECEKEAIVTLDDQNKLMFFNSDEMRLVVYDTMLPSQRETIHLLYCQWFRDMTRPRRNSSISSSAQPPPSPKNATNVPTNISPSSVPRPSLGAVNKRPSFAGGATTLLAVLDPSSSLKSRLQQQFAMLGYHLSRSGNAKPSLEAYQKAAELALENRDLSFATDCMQSSFKILEDGPRVNKLNDLDYILVRSKIEFLRGAIAIEKSEWDMAIMHMSYIIRLCQRKGSVLRRYSSSVYRNESVLESTKTLAAKVSSVRFGSAAATLQPGEGGGAGISLLRLNLGDSMLYMEMQQRCLPRFFNFQRLMPSGYPASLSMFFTGVRRSVNSGGSRRSSRGGNLLRMGSGTGLNRVQPEETLLALNQVHFYKKKAEVLIKKINVSRKKQEEMSREIQKLTQKSLKKTQKR